MCQFVQQAGVQAFTLVHPVLVGLVGLARRALLATVRLAKSINSGIKTIRLQPEPIDQGMSLNNLRAMYARMSFRPNGELYMTTTVDEFLRSPPPRIATSPPPAPARRRR